MYSIHAKDESKEQATTAQRPPSRQSGEGRSTRSLKEATIRTILRRLEQKGYLAHEADGRAYVYRAVEPRRGLAARAVRQIIDRFCHGSVEDLVSGMVDAKLLTKAELRALEDLVRERRKVASKSLKKG
jgi:BlaI family transcriptional regulator, penicillinase repressor